MYLVFWSYKVKPQCIEEFRKHYSSDGTWAQFFRKAPAYAGTDLFTDVTEQHRFLTIDKWKSQEEYQTFMKSNEAEYSRLDHECGNLTEDEERLGDLES